MKKKKNLKNSFTLLELVIVIIIIGILAATISISIPNNKVQTEADKIKTYFRLAHSAALKYDGWDVSKRFWSAVCFEINESNNSVSVYIKKQNTSGVVTKEYLTNPLNQKDLNETAFKSTLSASVNVICFSPFGDMFENNISESTLITKNEEINITDPTDSSEKRELIITSSGFIYDLNTSE